MCDGLIPGLRAGDHLNLKTMKKTIIVLLLLMINILQVFSQGNIQINENDESIQQIRTSGLADILSFQMQNQGISNMSLTKQMGNLNKTSVNQQSDASSYFSNQAYSIQLGNSNEMTIGQIGSGNLLLGFQLGYITSELVGGNKNDQFKSVIENSSTNASEYENVYNQSIVVGEGNNLKVSQFGNKNAIVAIQQGSENSIEADQNGNNNYLVIYQKGKNNEVVGYKQENISDRALAETIIQEGEGLSLNAFETSKSKPNGNSFIQKGINLLLEVNNQFTNTLGGIEVSQSGHDMKVVVDQSYFSLPMK